jgi:hypothetical protein
MNRNRLIIIIIVIALLAVGLFTIRAIQNTRQLLSPAPEEGQEVSSVDDEQNEGAVEVAIDLPTEVPELNESVKENQPVGTSALDLARIIELTVIPHDLDVDDQGNIYVVGADVTNPQILKYDRDGNLLASWGGQGSGEGQFVFAAPPMVLHKKVVSFCWMIWARSTSPIPTTIAFKYSTRMEISKGCGRR